MDFWQGVAIIGLALTAIGAGLGVVALVRSGRQTRATTQLIADGHAATQLTLTDVHATTQETLKTMHTATQTTLGQLGQVLDRMDQAAEARYRDLKDRRDGEEERP